MKSKSILLIIIIILIGIWYTSIPQEKEFELPIFTPADLRLTLVHPSLIGKTEHTIPDFSFINQDSILITQDTIAGKIYVVDFFFTSCPSICIDLTKNLQLVQEAFQEENNVLILSHSVDPKNDTVARLKKYADIHNINPKKWFLLRGSIEEITRMAQLGYFAIASVDNHDRSELIHTENVILVDQDRKIRGIYNGTSSIDIGYLISDIKKLKN